MLKKVLLCFLVSFVLMPAYGHGDLHKRIKRVTKEIKNNPDSAFLYLKRGELYYQHGDCKLSIKDFKTCSGLAYDTHRLDLAYAKTYSCLRKEKKAIHFLDKILAEDRNHVRALRLKGRVLASSGRYAAAGQCFEKVITYSEKTLPENYLEASLAWENSQIKDDSQKAIRVIEKGCQDIGDLMVFYDRLVELHWNDKNYSKALTCQTTIIEKSNRKENAYYRRAQIYLDSGDKKAAHTDFKKSLASIRKLPPRIQQNTAIRDLKTNITRILKDL